MYKSILNAEHIITMKYAIVSDSAMLLEICIQPVVLIQPEYSKFQMWKKYHATFLFRIKYLNLSLLMLLLLFQTTQRTRQITFYAENK